MRVRQDDRKRAPLIRLSGTSSPPGEGVLRRVLSAVRSTITLVHTQGFHDVKEIPNPRLHADRAAGGHRHHRRPDLAAACRPSSRPARRRGGSSARTTSSSSGWRPTTTTRRFDTFPTATVHVRHHGQHLGTAATRCSPTSSRAASTTRINFSFGVVAPESSTTLQTTIATLPLPLRLRQDDAARATATTRSAMPARTTGPTEGTTPVPSTRRRTSRTTTGLRGVPGREHRPDHRRHEQYVALRRGDCWATATPTRCRSRRLVPDHAAECQPARPLQHLQGTQYQRPDRRHQSGFVLGPDLGDGVVSGHSLHAHHPPERPELRVQRQQRADDHRRGEQRRDGHDALEPPSRRSQCGLLRRIGPVRQEHHRRRDLVGARQPGRRRGGLLGYLLSGGNAVMSLHEHSRSSERDHTRSMSKFRARRAASSAALALAAATASVSRGRPRTEDFRGKIGKTDKDSRPDYPPPVRPRQGAPNVVYILLDDLGFSDLGCYGSEIRTPHIDRLAANGLRYNNYHSRPSARRPAPPAARAGTPHSVGLRTVANYENGFPNGRGQITHAAATVAELLRSSGYATFAFGKWHLVPPRDTSAAGPVRPVAAPARVRPVLRLHERHDRPVSSRARAGQHPDRPAEPARLPPHRGPRRPGDPVRAAARWLRGRTSRSSSTSPSGATHSPHQVARPYIDKYVPVFEKGWDRTREDRLARQKQTRHRPRAHGPRAAEPGDQALGQPGRRREAALRPPPGGLRRVPRAHRRADRQAARLPQDRRSIRQHDRGRERGQRRKPRRRPRTAR